MSLSNPIRASLVAQETDYDASLATAASGIEAIANGRSSSPPALSTATAASPAELTSSPGDAKAALKDVNDWRKSKERGTCSLSPRASDSSSDEPRRHRRAARSEDESVTRPKRKRRQQQFRKPSRHAERDGEAKAAQSDASEAPVATLENLEQVLSAQKIREHRGRCSTLQVRRGLVALALATRLVRSGDSIRHSLMEAYRAGDKQSFATLYNAVHDVRDSCDAAWRHALLAPDLRLEISPERDSANDPFSDRTFLHEIPLGARNELLGFLSTLRTDPELLVQRVLSLSGQEIDNLTAMRPAADLGAVFAGQGSRERMPSGSGINSRASRIHASVGQLMSFQRHDPFSILFHSLFAVSAGPGSADDTRRTELWSSVCAKLITDPRPGGEKLFSCVLNAYSEMREWPGKQQLQDFLMRALRDGHFLVENGEDRASRSQMSTEASDPAFAAQRTKYLENTVERLFEVLDSPSPGGLPPGALEISRAVNQRLSDDRHRRTLQRFVMHRWFFGKFLASALIYPEQHGIMTDYAVSEIVRKSVLHPLALDAQRQVNEVLYRWSAPSLGHSDSPHERSPTKRHSPVPSTIGRRIESLVSRIQEEEAATLPDLLTKKSTMSLRETDEAQPILVICPADLVTLVDALYPERRPPSNDLGHPFSGSILNSPGSSISGFSFRPSTPGDGSSVFSTSASSMTSNTTSRAPFPESFGREGSQTSLDLSINETTILSPSGNEDYGRLIRGACAEMVQVLGGQVAAGNCHPCAEHWAVLYVSENGRKLGLQAEALDEMETNSALDEESVKHDLSTTTSDQIELEQAIVHLLRQFELHANIRNSNGERSQVAMRKSDRTIVEKNSWRSQRGKKDAQAFAALLTETGIEGDLEYLSLQSSSKQWSRDLKTRPQAAKQEGESHSNRLSPGTPPGQETSRLILMLEAAKKHSLARSDFVSAEFYHRAWSYLSNLTRPGDAHLIISEMIDHIGRNASRALSKAKRTLDVCEAWMIWLQQMQERVEAFTQVMMAALHSLRDKMWYNIDVCHSAAYEEVKSISWALRTMGLPPKPHGGRQGQPRLRHMKTSANAFLLRQEGQVLELMAASKDMGGPNKLSDEQSDAVAKWLHKTGIENLCKGEERIHRFCFGVVRCLDKLLGERVLDAPVLWSSELFRRDRDLLESGTERADLLVSHTRAARVDRLDSSPHALIPLESTHNGAIRLRSGPSHEPARSGLKSNPVSPTRSVGLPERQAYGGAVSPVYNQALSPAVWSPFHSRAGGSRQSDTGHTGLRPPLMALSSTSDYDKSAERKRTFLQELKRSLTGLLLSDLGVMVFNEGSETDDWFSDELGQACWKRRMQLNRQEAFERDDSKQARQRSDMRESTLTETSSNAKDDNSVHTAEGTDSPLPEHTSSGRFTYHVVCRQLLQRFATVVNPYAKLDALYELQKMLIKRDEAAAPHLLDSDQYPAMKPNAEQQASASGFGRSKQSDRPRANAFVGPSRTRTTPPHSRADQLICSFRNLFLDSECRPRALFRDLQYIASLVPGFLLNGTARGDAFCNAAMAALGLKEDMCSVMIETADVIVARITESRVGGQPQPNIPESPDSAAEVPAMVAESHDSPRLQRTARLIAEENSLWEARLASLTMADAVRMLIITAKEGYAVAERELAIFYLTHPELLPRVLSPLTKPREVFKTELLAQRDRERQKKGDQALDRADPMTMCVAHHWMECGRRGGDQLAIKYLRNRDEMEKIP